MDFSRIQDERYEKEYRIEKHQVCKKGNEVIGDLCAGWKDRNEFEMVLFHINQFVESKLRILFNNGRKGDILKHGRKSGTHGPSFERRLSGIIEEAKVTHKYDQQKKRVEKMRRDQKELEYSEEAFWESANSINDSSNE